jgi:hypothetical protein
VSLRPQSILPLSLQSDLTRQLNRRDLRLVETTLAFYDPEQVLEALAAILVHERRRQKLRRTLGKLFNRASGVAFVLWFLTTFRQSEFVTYVGVGIALRIVHGVVTSVSKSATLRGKNAQFVASACIQRGSRQSLGAVLIIAESGLFGSHNERDTCRAFLEVALVRSPISELLTLTEAQRAALRTVTANALVSVRKDDRFTTLASAGLLALGTLQDPALREQATRATALPGTAVQAAAVEYLSAVH